MFIRTCRPRFPMLSTHSPLFDKFHLQSRVRNERWSKEDPSLTKTLFTSLDRPIFEYGSLLWSPQFIIHKDRIDRRRIFVFDLRSLYWGVISRLASYPTWLLLLKLPFLDNRRTLLGVVFINNLIRAHIDSNDLLDMLISSVPGRITWLPFANTFQF